MSSTRSTLTLALEARFASRMASALTAGTQSLPHDITARLRFARELAATRARDARVGQRAAGNASVSVSSAGVGTLGRFGHWGERFASVLPLLVLVSGLLMIERWAVREQVLAAAEIDALLLSDDLPPAAYSDPGFGEFLRNSPTP